VIANSPESWSVRSQERLSHEAAMWSSQGQQARFDAVLSALKPQPHETILDFGCGTGLLSKSVPSGVGYLGYDWSEGMVARARNDHPGRVFTTNLIVCSHDLVACVGTFNLHDSWSKQQTWDKLGFLWNHCGRALAVCLYAGDDPDCIEYLDSECIAFAKSTGADWLLNRHLPNDLLLVLERPPVAAK